MLSDYVAAFCVYDNYQFEEVTNIMLTLHNLGIGNRNVVQQVDILGN